jgi:hypothetical protein
VIDLVLDRPRLARSQFVFTETRGRQAIFWQTQKAAKAANPGARIPRARAIPGGFSIVIDTRERYPYRFANRGVRTERLPLPAGDYGVLTEGNPIASVERKTLENLASALSDGTLAFQMQRLSEIPSTAVVVDGRYSALFKLEHVSGAWLANREKGVERAVRTRDGTTVAHETLDHAAHLSQRGASVRRARGSLSHTLPP